ncbi:hypothetical protein IV102_02755 [bacterium]|nr:hypothetical protein [bacterium]
MLPSHLGQPARCNQCGQLTPSSDLLYEGPELEPICLACLRQLDPARAQLLETIQQQRRKT